jgi:hypothetical protein
MPLLPFRQIRLNAFAIWALLIASGPALSDTLCAKSPFDTPPEIAEVMNTVSVAITGFDGLQTTLETSVSEICISDHLLKTRGYFEPATNRIVVASDLPKGLLQAVMVHELRHAEQNEQGVCPSLSLGMKDYAQAVFAIEADASVTTLVAAARLREAGDQVMWDALANWPMQADIARVFNETMIQTNDLAQAAHDAFEAWFTDDRRIDAYYVSSCSDYLEQTELQHLLPQYGRIEAKFLSQLCTLPDGTRYRCAIPAK